MDLVLWQPTTMLGLLQQLSMASTHSCIYTMSKEMKLWASWWTLLSSAFQFRSQEMESIWSWLEVSRTLRSPFTTPRRTKSSLLMNLSSHADQKSSCRLSSTPKTTTNSASCLRQCATATISIKLTITTKVRKIKFCLSPTDLKWMSSETKIANSSSKNSSTTHMTEFTLPLTDLLSWWWTQKLWRLRIP